MADGFDRLFPGWRNVDPDGVPVTVPEDVADRCGWPSAPKPSPPAEAELYGELND